MITSIWLIVTTTKGENRFAIGRWSIQENYIGGTNYGALLAQRTLLGWILSGGVENHVGGVIRCLGATSGTESTEKLLTKFWETEEKVYPQNRQRAKNFTSKLRLWGKTEGMCAAFLSAKKRHLERVGISL